MYDPIPAAAFERAQTQKATRAHAPTHTIRRPLMPDTSTTPPPAPGGPKGYPGRPDLDAANARFRRAVARLWREGTRHNDPDTRAAVGPIVAEAVQVLDRLAAAATTAEGNSARHRKALAAEEAKLARLERRLGRPIGGGPARGVGRR